MKSQVLPFLKQSKLTHGLTESEKTALFIVLDEFEKYTNQSQPSDEVCPKCETKQFFIDYNRNEERRCRLCFTHWENPNKPLLSDEKVKKVIYTPNTGDEFEADSLLPCPFCGGKAKLLFIGNDYTESKKVEIKCTNKNCRIRVVNRGLRSNHKQIALRSLEIWNKRDNHQSKQIKITWNNVKEKYLKFHKMDKFTENMSIDIDFGYWLSSEINQPKQNNLKSELRKFADSLIEGYEDDTTVIELLHDDSVIDNYMEFYVEEESKQIDWMRKKKIKL